jgi:hypothetical protein
LTAEQLVALHQQLAPPTGIPTRGEDTRTVLRHIMRSLPLSVTVTESARRVLDEGHRVVEDLEKVSPGTTLATTLRPLGLVLVPTHAGDGPALVITDAREVEEAWPVGWPIERRAKELVPQMFEFLEVEITEHPLDQVLSALESRLGIPFLMDQNGIARQRIDLAAVKVSYPAGRTFYKKVINRVLAQGRLTSELRVDEAGLPFFWISPVRKEDRQRVN